MKELLVSRDSIFIASHEQMSRRREWPASDHWSDGDVSGVAGRAGAGLALGAAGRLPRGGAGRERGRTIRFHPAPSRAVRTAFHEYDELWAVGGEPECDERLRGGGRRL